MNLSHIRGEGHVYSLTFPLLPPYAMLLANWFFLFVLTWYPTRLSPLKFSSSWRDMFFLSKFFHVFVVTITSCKNVVTPWAKSALTDFIRKSTRNLVQKNKSHPPSPILSRSSVLYVILLSYINIAEGGVGDTLCCITRWTVISCRGNISQLLLQLFVALEFWESLKENALKKKFTPLPTISLFRTPIIVP